MKKKILCLLLALILVLTTGCKKKQPEQIQQEQIQSEQTQTVAPEETEPATLPALEITEILEEGDLVTVTTTFGTVSYPFAFSDLLSVAVEEDRLVFNANLEEAVPVFVIRFDDQAPIRLGSFYFSQTQQTLIVSAELMELPEGMDASQSGFYAAQETFNDVVNSLSENQNFTPEQ